MGLRTGAPRSDRRVVAAGVDALPHVAPRAACVRADRRRQHARHHASGRRSATRWCSAPSYGHSRICCRTACLRTSCCSEASSHGRSSTTRRRVGAIRAAGTAYPPGTSARDATAIAIGTAAWLVFGFWLHAPLIGVRPYLKRKRRQRSDAHAQQPDAARELHALQAFARGATDGLRVLRRRFDGAVARDRLEVVEAKLDADRAPGIALAREIACEASRRDPRRSPTARRGRAALTGRGRTSSRG